MCAKKLMSVDITLSVLLLLSAAFLTCHGQKELPTHLVLPKLIPLPVIRGRAQLRTVTSRVKAHGVMGYPADYVAAAPAMSYVPTRTVYRYTGNATANWVGEYNPLLSGGVRGAPGIRIRLNMRTFQWASSWARQMIDQQLPSLQIPDIHESITQFNGQVSVTNVHISKFRPPCNVAVYPAAPNRIMVAIDDFDIGVTGNLGGSVTVLLPIPLCGIIQADLYHVSVRVGVTLGRSPNGAPCIIVDACQVDIGYVDVCIINGGLVGTIINLLFRKDVANSVKSMVPGRICSEIPKVVAEKLNPKLQSIPQSIAFNDIASIAQNLLRSNVPAYCNSPYCLNRKEASATSTEDLKKIKDEKGTNETESETYDNPFASSDQTFSRGRAYTLRYVKAKNLKNKALTQFAHRRAARQAAPTVLKRNIQIQRQPYVKTPLIPVQ
ncbi:unnamed protein product, partial [Enterobius vermicularis]|uniref:BPI1 domain-containing protein n=1 Tax=Enterobius vermicularis TaxID=51028 RepID=A0A0N4VQX2_ENTVE